MRLKSRDSQETEYNRDLLFVVHRNGVSHYPFSQFANLQFPNVPIVSVRRWLSTSGRVTKTINSDERAYFRQQGCPSYRALITEDDIKAIVAYSKGRRKYKRRAKQLSSETINSSSSRNSCDLSVTLPLVESTARNVDEQNVTNVVEMSSPARPNNHCDLSALPTNVDEQNVANVVEMSSPARPNNHCDLSVTLPLVESSSDETVRNHRSTHKIGCLPNEAITPSLKEALSELREFYTTRVNPLRHSAEFSESTMKKFLERVSCFLNYCRIEWPDRTLDFDVVNDFEIVQAYIRYQLEERGLNVATVVRTLTALTNLTKYVHRLNRNKDSCIEFVRLKNIQHQLSQQQRSYQLAAKAGLCTMGSDANERFMFNHVLETVRKLREKLENSTRDGETNLRVLHDFVLLSLYVTSMCGRSKELRTLQLFDELVEGRTFQFDWRKKCNVLVVSADSRTFTLYENDFKTLRSHGPSKLQIEDSLWIVPYLKQYNDARKVLLRGKTHPYMFVTATGLAFSSSSFTIYLANLFEKEVNIRAGTTKLRHALVTHVLSLPESESLKLRESLAVLMRHSLKHQQFTYCDISRQDQTSLSRNLLNRSLEEHATVTSKKSPTVGTRREGHVFAAGDMVALIDGATTCAEDASVFLARVVKLATDKDEALLMEFRKVSGSEILYRAVVGVCNWWETIDSLVYPIDVVYRHEDDAYELRSSVAEIYDAAAFR